MKTRGDLLAQAAARGRECDEAYSGGVVVQAL